MDNTSESEVKPKRAPRQRAQAKRKSATERPVSSASTPRGKTTTRKVKNEESPEVPVEATVSRKAPTPLAAERTSKQVKRRQLIIVGLILAAGIGSSAAVGSSDKGVIDVNETIAQRNEKIKASNQTEEVIVPVQNTSKLPNGGLKGRGITNPPPPVIEATASSTDNTASSTDSVASTTEETVEESTGEET